MRIFGIIDSLIDVRQILILSTLAVIIPLYPTLHKTSHSALSALCLGYLNGNPFKPANISLTSTASRLYAVLHFTGGKVGAANVWRKSIDETLAFGWTSFFLLRSTFLVEGRSSVYSFAFFLINIQVACRNYRPPLKNPSYQFLSMLTG
jgi:hypothetical protein